MIPPGVDSAAPERPQATPVTRASRRHVGAVARRTPTGAGGRAAGHRRTSSAKAPHVPGQMIGPLIWRSIVVFVITGIAREGLALCDIQAASIEHWNLIVATYW